MKRLLESWTIATLRVRVWGWRVRAPRELLHVSFAAQSVPSAARVAAQAGPGGRRQADMMMRARGGAGDLPTPGS